MGSLIHYGGRGSTALSVAAGVIPSAMASSEGWSGATSSASATPTLGLMYFQTLLRRAMYIMI